MDELNAIIAYEQGELNEEETVELFQHLIETGLAWKLQGHYGRTAKFLIDEGLCTPAWTLKVDKHEKQEQ